MLEGDEADGRESLELVRSLSDRCRKVAMNLPSRGKRCRRSIPGTPTRVERLICVRDLVHATTDHVERLATAVHPGVARYHLVEPTAAYGLWDPDDLVAVLRAETEQLACAAEELFADDRLPDGVRHGLALIIVELLGHMLGEAAHQLNEADAGSRP